ncbi:MAG: WecB/TagA/CpsF family glycosyltransferase [Kiritimatiellae bacterium]|jgi:N-acetylglucosaminyldiphosphoundecaprenol N-acetyl-beta-D-mannosaminyltransferase|nr:WecB/TagA/CpsF family glycosyltransferase [Kiritimatiellia bacterium]
MAKIFKLILNIIPLIVLTSVLVILSFLKTKAGYVPPLWLCILIFLLIIIGAYDYIIRLNMQKRIGGWMAIGAALLILTGMLIPSSWVGVGPANISEKFNSNFIQSWNQAKQENFIENQADKTIEFIISLGNLDYFSYGQIILFAILGIAVGICFLFGTTFKSRHEYLLNILAIIVGTIWFALFAEAIQVFAPSRVVAWGGLLESLTGAMIGLFIIISIRFLHELHTKLHPKTSHRFNVLGVGVDALNMQGCINKFEEIINTNTSYKPQMTSALGVAGIIEARRNPKMQRILNQSVLNTADGMPLVWLGKLHGYNTIDRVYGPDLLRDVCAYSADKSWKHFFYGAAPGIVEKLQEKLEEKHPNIQISGIYCPPFRPLTEQEEKDLIERIDELKPDIFWIGISTPKQLYFMDQMKDKLACKIICPVGYAFDVNAGVEIDAPDWIKYSGFQWLHRVFKQPRLVKRYLPDNPRFIFETFLQILHLKKYPMFLHEQPLTEDKDQEGYIRYPVGVTSVSAMTLQSAVDRVLNWIKTGQSHHVNVCTADTMVQCFEQPELAKIVLESGMATTDGMPLMILGKLRGYNVTRVYGPDLMLELCRQGIAKNTRHYFYGATDEVLKKLRTNLKTQFENIQIAGMYSPPFRPLTEQEEADIINKINETNPDIVWCGLGTPKQDYWVAKFQPHLNSAASIAVGAAFNFHAGEVRQAPRWMMKLSLEWLFRLFIEPKRLWKRYLIGNPRFIILSICEYFKEKKYKKRKKK